LHTIAVYTDSYVGDVVVQATLENQVTGTTNWADITTETLSGSETEPTPINFNGVYTYLRVKATANPANTISKILVRN
jgi:redox-regulated HSP33 family molecular chaperone